MKNFKQRWNITSNWQLVIILIVFAFTGSSAAYVSKPILHFFGINKGEVSLVVYYISYIALIFPVYQILLLFYGFIFGQFKFFWAFEKKMLTNLGLGFLFK
jgi:hypothetical protein